MELFKRFFQATLLAALLATAGTVHAQFATVPDTFIPDILTLDLESSTLTNIADDETLVGTGSGTAGFTPLQNCNDGTHSLDWNGTAFVCNLITGGSASNSFETHNVPTGTDPVADGSTDILNVTATGPIIITGTAASDTIDYQISGTLAQFNTAITDATLATGGGTATNTNTGDSQTLAAGVSDVNATAAEVNVLDLSAVALTIGWGYFADGASTASWRQLLGSEISNDLGWTTAAGTVTAVTGGTGVDSTGGATPDLSLDLSELGVSTMVTGDWIAFDNAGVSNKALISAIPLSIFNNDSGWTANAGTVTSVTGGTGVDSTGGTTPDLSIDFSELGVATAVAGDWLAFDNAGVSNKALISTFPLSLFSDDLGHVENVTHTSEVTGATALTVNPVAISNKATVTPVATDMLLLLDATDSALKKVDAGDFLSGSGDVTAAAVMTDNTLVKGDGGAKGVQDSGIVVDDSNNMSGIGTINQSGGITTAGVTSSGAVIADTSATYGMDNRKGGAYSSTSGGGFRVYGDSTAGPITSGSRLGVYAFGSAEDASSTISVGAEISAFASETWGATANGAQIRFYTTPNTSTTQTLAFEIQEDQDIRTYGNIELDHATDTTIARVAAGRISVEGVDYSLEYLPFPITDHGTATTTGTKWIHYTMYAFEIVDIEASCSGAGTTGTMVMDVHLLDGTPATIMTTDKLDIETLENGTWEATTQPALTTTTVAAHDGLQFDIDTIQTTPATGCTVTFEIYRT